MCHRFSFVIALTEINKVNDFRIPRRCRRRHRRGFLSSLMYKQAASERKNILLRTFRILLLANLAPCIVTPPFKEGDPEQFHLAKFHMSAM